MARLNHIPRRTVGRVIRPGGLITSAYRSIGQSGLGPELVVNGDFENGDEGWTPLDSSWSISGGTANNDGTNTGFADLRCQTPLVVGKNYFAVYTLVERTAARVRLTVGSRQSPYTGTPGTYEHVAEDVLTASFNIRAEAGFIGKVDNVSLREILGPVP